MVIVVVVTAKITTITKGIVLQRRP